MKKSTVLLPKAQKAASILGENIRLARLRRKYSTQQVSERANIRKPKSKCKYWSLYQGIICPWS